MRACRPANARLLHQRPDTRRVPGLFSLPRFLDRPFGRRYNPASFGSLAQLVEQRTFNPLVTGSNPVRPTKKIQTLKPGRSDWAFCFPATGGVGCATIHGNRTGRHRPQERKKADSLEPAHIPHCASLQTSALVVRSVRRSRKNRHTRCNNSDAACGSRRTVLSLPRYAHR